MNNRSRINEILHLILAKREKDGGFYGYTNEIYKLDTRIQNIFISSVVCRLLLEASESIKYIDYNLHLKIKKYTQKTITLIEKNRKTEGTWNYYTNKNQKDILPDDLDDTFNCLLALDLFDEDKTNSETLLTTMNVLLKTEHKIGKMSAYNTWVTNIMDIDPVVQVIIYKFLSRIRSVPSDFNIFLTESLTKLKDSVPISKYYQSKLYILMELSSISESINYTDNFKKYLKRVPNNILDSIAYYQIKSNLKILKKEDIQKIYQINCTSKKTPPFYIEKNMSKYRQHCYSDVIVLAFYLRLLCSISVPTENKVYAKSHIYEDLTKSCQKELSTFNSNITDLHRTLFGEYKIIDHIIDEFVSWSKYLNFDLSNKNNVNYLNQVAKYTYYGWIAYTASDSIVDDQISKKYLPIGNHFLFKSSNIINNVIYSTCGSNLKVLSKVQDYIDTIYQRLHRANYIESNSSIRNMRDVLYTLNNKSIGHSIGFLILYIKQKEYNLRDMDLILKYFDLHLSMRQLSDDIHDWRIDIEQKRVTLPTFLLRNIKKKGREVYINHNIIPKVHKHMQTLKTSLDTTLKKLRHILNTEDRIRLSDQSHKYLRGVKQAIKEIEFYKKIKEQSIN